MAAITLPRSRCCSAPSGVHVHAVEALRAVPVVPSTQLQGPRAHDRPSTGGCLEIAIPGCLAMHVIELHLGRELSTQNVARRPACIPCSRSYATRSASAHPKAGPRRCRHSAVRPTAVGNILLLDWPRGTTRPVIPCFITSSELVIPAHCLARVTLWLAVLAVGGVGALGLAHPRHSNSAGSSLGGTQLSRSPGRHMGHGTVWPCALLVLLCGTAFVEASSRAVVDSLSLLSHSACRPLEVRGRAWAKSNACLEPVRSPCATRCRPGNCSRGNHSSQGPSGRPANRPFPPPNPA